MAGSIVLPLIDEGCVVFDHEGVVYLLVNSYLVERQFAIILAHVRYIDDLIAERKGERK